MQQCTLLTKVHVVVGAVLGVLVDPSRHRSPSKAPWCNNPEETQHTLHQVHADMVCMHTYPQAKGQVQGETAKVAKVAATAEALDSAPKT